jgi:hypothetical protein
VWFATVTHQKCHFGAHEIGEFPQDTRLRQRMAQLCQLCACQQLVAVVWSVIVIVIAAAAAVVVVADMTLSQSV